MKELFAKFTSVVLASLLLLTATSGKMAGLRKANGKKPVAEQAKGQQAGDERPVIQDMSLEAVVSPAISFDFEQSFYFLTAFFGVELPAGNTLFKRFDVFYYFFSFFRNVFGHFIAINAP